LAIIAQALPGARAIGMLYRSDTAEGRLAKDRMLAALPAGWKLEAVAVNDLESKSRAIDELLSRKLDCVWTAPDPAIYDVATIRSLLLAALRRSVPVYGFSQALVRAGGLIGANIDPAGQGFQLARILNTDLDIRARSPAPPLPSIAQVPEHQVVVNLIVADKLGITVPEALVQRSAIVFRNDPPRNGAAP
jgi:putative ABC transport system substrate-binding protein